MTDNKATEANKEGDAESKNGEALEMIAKNTPADDQDGGASQPTKKAKVVEEVFVVTNEEIPTTTTASANKAMEANEKPVDNEEQSSSAMTAQQHPQQGVDPAPATPQQGSDPPPPPSMNGEQTQQQQQQQQQTPQTQPQKAQEAGMVTATATIPSQQQTGAGPTMGTNPSAGMMPMMAGMPPPGGMMNPAAAMVPPMFFPNPAMAAAMNPAMAMQMGPMRGPGGVFIPNAMMAAAAAANPMMAAQSMNMNAQMQMNYAAMQMQQQQAAAMNMNMAAMKQQQQQQQLQQQSPPNPPPPQQQPQQKHVQTKQQQKSSPPTKQQSPETPAPAPQKLEESSSSPSPVAIPSITKSSPSPSAPADKSDGKVDNDKKDDDDNSNCTAVAAAKRKLDEVESSSDAGGSGDGPVSVPASAPSPPPPPAATAGTETAEEIRERNREHARSTRMRKKAYIQKLKELVEGMNDTKTEEKIQRRVAIQTFARQQQERKSTIRQFLKFHSTNVQDPNLWATVIEQDFCFQQPITPYRSFRRSEIDKDCRISTGINGMIADAASMAVMIESIGSKTNRWKKIRSDNFEKKRKGEDEGGNGILCRPKAMYFVNDDDMMIAGDVIMFSFTFRTQDAITCGAFDECVSPGMLRGQFSSHNNKLINMEITYDAFSFMQQLEHASGSDDISTRIIPSSLDVALSPNMLEARAITSAKPPYEIKNVNETWTKLYKYSESDAKGQEWFHMLEKGSAEQEKSNETAESKNSYNLANVVAGRCECTTRCNYDKDGRKIIDYISSYPLTK